MGTGNESYQIRNRERNCTSDSTFKKHNNDSQILTGTKVVNGISGIKKSQVTQLQKSYVQLNGHVPKEKESNIQRRVTKENSWNNSSFNGGTNEYTEDAFIDKGYHTIEKGFNLSSVNYRKNFFTENSKQSRERPNSFHQKDKVNERYLYNESSKYNDKNIGDESHRNFKPILKSFASEDNLNSQTDIKSRSKSTEKLDNIVSINNNNNKNRVRWNIQEKNKNMINLKEGNNYYKNKDYNSLTRNKPINNIQNVKNDVVYAGKGEIIEIKNNQIINIKSVPQHAPSKTFKNEPNNKTFMKDEICTEL